LAQLVEKLGQDHPRLGQVLALRSHLLENVMQTRQGGDSENHRAERARIVRTLNELSLNEIGLSFNELCGFPASSLPLAPSVDRLLIENRAASRRANP
jgi:hypothetical protein